MLELYLYFLLLFLYYSPLGFRHSLPSLCVWRVTWFDRSRQCRVARRQKGVWRCHTQVETANRHCPPADELSHDKPQRGVNVWINITHLCTSDWSTETNVTHLKTRQLLHVSDVTCHGRLSKWWGVRTVPLRSLGYVALFLVSSTQVVGQAYTMPPSLALSAKGRRGISST